VTLLGPVLTTENLDALVSRAAYRTKAEVEEIVVSLRPRPEPTEGIRKLPSPPPAAHALSEQTNRPVVGIGLLALVSTPTAVTPTPATAAIAEVAPASTIAPRPSPARVEPVAEDRWSVRVTLDAEAKSELETLKALLSHKIPSGDVGEVLREAIRCAIEKHGKRRGAVSSSWKQHVAGEKGTAVKSQDGSAVPASQYIPASVRREVWKRDGGRCTFVGSGDCRCNSRWRLEFDHIVPFALGGTSTVDNIRLRCRGHNLLHAERVFGRDHMDQFRRPAVTIAGDSSSRP
jgi:hypothetical protein